MAMINFSIPNMNKKVDMYNMGMMGTLRTTLTTKEIEQVKLFTKYSKIRFLPLSSVDNIQWMDVTNFKKAFYTPPSLLKIKVSSWTSTTKT